MAQFKDRGRVTHSNDAVLFDTKHAQGTRPENPGIYRCTGCGDEVLVARGEALPRKRHEGQWQLLVLAELHRK